MRATIADAKSAAVPSFFVRASDGKVRVFYNTCRHRGALVCRHDQGNGEIFQCFYHAWTFNSRGELIGVPDEEGYAEGFDKADLSLLSPPHVDSYRGFIFVCYDPNAMDLRSYLAGATEFIDLVVDQSEAGMRVVEGSNRYSIKANWKLLVENSFDNYHVAPTHKTYIDYQTSLGVEILPQSERWSEAYSLGNGHAVMEFAATAGRPTARWSPLFGEDTKEEIAALRARLVERHGEERTVRMADRSRNLLIFPNLYIIDVAGLTLRTFWPVAHDEIEVQAWEMVPKDEEAASRAPGSTASSPSSAPAVLPPPTTPRPWRPAKQGLTPARSSGPTSPAACTSNVPSPSTNCNCAPSGASGTPTSRERAG